MEILSSLEPCSPLPFTRPKPTSFCAIPSKNSVIFCRFSRIQTDPNLNLRRSINVQKQQMVRRNFVVRSEIAATGSPESVPYPIKEFQLGSKLRAICFYTVTATTAIPLFMLMALVHPIVMLFDRYRRRAHHLIAKVWASVSIAPFYRFEMEGLENLPCWDVPAVYVSNHQSFLDTYTLLTLGRNFKFISKTSIFVIPIVGWAMFLMGLIPLRRMDSRSQLCVELLKKGASVFFFPEGTRSKDGKLGSFRKGAFSVAVKTGVPVVPITLLGTGNLMPSGKESVLNSGSVKVIMHKPIRGTNADALCSEARNVIADTLVLHGYGVHNIE
ncbi:1-acyl-sn-glycerol-3-phosphate acyltransferase 1, chloroplastic [Asparagus officinalis]|uniref:1-acyl-sn-glycerol-3-phosphate acyltransferase 1, chloroplastic n=1 Tax=Asparagus officinalis TaxID=4686 RepID=UPI00098E70DE|nr:1-acyl-sn-glycerol-3-phosphate acyltransferase 1, chloroplastic [Asparagus officinalis]